MAALKPARAMPARLSGLRAPDETDTLSRLLGAGIARNHYGEHLAIRNWFATPEFSEPSPVALDMLTKAPTSESGRYKPRAGRLRRTGPTKAVRAMNPFRGGRGRRCRTPKSGFSWIRKPPGWPAARAHTRFWWDWHGGMPAACRWSNSSCAIFRRNTRCCRNGGASWRNVQCWSRSMGNRLIGRCWRIASR